VGASGSSDDFPGQVGNRALIPKTAIGHKKHKKSETFYKGAKSEEKSEASNEKTPASTVDLIGDLIRSKTDSSSTPATATATGQDPFSYYVQAGAFRSNEEAESQRAKLVMQGYDPRISDKEQGGKTVYRVRIGPLSAKEEAEKIQIKLATSKIEAAIVRVQR